LTLNGRARSQVERDQVLKLAREIESVKNVVIG
jgi:hypothetical protein